MNKRHTWKNYERCSGFLIRNKLFKFDYKLYAGLKPYALLICSQSLEKYNIHPYDKEMKTFIKNRYAELELDKYFECFEERIITHITQPRLIISISACKKGESSRDELIRLIYYTGNLTMQS